MAKIKFNTAEETTSNKYEEGIYTAKITGAREGSWNSGTEYIEVDLETTNGIEINKKFSLTPKAINELMKLYSILGLYEKGGEEPDFCEFDLVGNWLEIELIKGEPQPALKKDGTPNKNAGRQYLELKHFGFEKGEAPAIVAEPKKEVAAPPF